MPTPRKPLPYAAGQLVDIAMAYNLDAGKVLRQIIDTPMTSEERYRLLAKAVDKLHQSTAALKEVSQIGKTGELGT